MPCSAEPYTPAYLTEFFPQDEENLKKFVEEWKNFHMNKYNRNIAARRRRSHEFFEEFSPKMADTVRDDLLLDLKMFLNRPLSISDDVDSQEKEVLQADVKTDSDVIMRTPTGGLYYYLRYFRRDFDLQRILITHKPLSEEYSDEFDQFVEETNLLNILTLSAKVDKHLIWARLISNNPNFKNYYGKIFFALLDLGIFCGKKTCKLFDRANCLCENFLESCVAKVRSRPLSLQKLARLAIRAQMKDVEILEDCYKLPLHKHLQDYVSLRCLHAQVRPWFLGYVEPHMCYHVTRELTKEYDIYVPPCSCHPQESASDASEQLAVKSADTAE